MKIVYKIGIPIIVITAMVIFVVSGFIRKSLEEIFIRETFLESQERVLRDANLLLGEEVLSNPFAVLSQTKFKEFFERVNDPSFARVSIWNRDHVVLYSNLKSIIGYSAPDHPDLQKLFAQESPFFLQKEKDTNKPVQSNVEEILDIYIPLSFSGNVVGAVEIQAVKQAVFQPIRQIIISIQYLLVAMASIASGVIFWIMFIFVLKPIALLSSASRAIQEGNLDYTLVYKSKDEVGILVVGFESMRKRLKVVVFNLKDAVRQRNEKVEELERMNQLMLGREVKMAELKKEIAGLKKTGNQNKA